MVGATDAAGSPAADRRAQRCGQLEAGVPVRVRTAKCWTRTGWIC